MSIVPCNWERFQHADATKRGKNPTWIKNYTALMSNDDYLDLTLAQRGLLHGIWLEYARTGRGLSEARTRRLLSTHKGDSRHFLAHLHALQTLGFIEFCQDNGVTASRLDIEVEEEEIVNKAVRSELRGTAWNESKQYELEKLMPLLHDADSSSADVLRATARGLPLASIAKVRESCEFKRRQDGRVGVGYAVNALKLEQNGLNKPNLG